MKHRAILIAVFAVATIASPAYAQFSLTVAPPTLQVEVRTAQPSPRYVWIGGYWASSGGQYVWAPGRWDVPQQEGATWQEVRWVRSDGGTWVSTPGRWVVAGASVNGTVYATQAPPRLRFERRGVAPSPDKVWISGYWQWDAGRYAWVSGQWATPEQEGARWIAPRWRQRGRRWIFVGGQWRGRVSVVQPSQQVVVPPRAVVVRQPSPNIVYVHQAAPAPQVVLVQPAPAERPAPQVLSRRRHRGHGGRH